MFFGSKKAPTDKLAAFSEKRNSILGVFFKMKEELETLNTELETEQNSKHGEIDDLRKLILEKEAAILECKSLFDLNHETMKNIEKVINK